MSRPNAWAAQLVLAASLGAALGGCSNPSSAWPDGVEVAPKEPIQDSPKKESGWAYTSEVYITPLANYDITARVLSIRAYKPGSDPLSVASPLDFALGWGEMSKSEVLRELDIHQGGRFYSYRWEGSPPIAGRLIALSSANIHLIPADPDVARRLHAVKAGDKVRLSGYLVEVAAPFGTARSSLTRADTGAGACEILWVERLDRTRAP